MGALLAPGLLIGQENPVAGLELLDALDQQLQLGREGVQVDVFHGVSLKLGLTGLYRRVLVRGQTRRWFCRACRC
ncbi:hypothetical protein D3C80_1989540 [compost metagenome]